MRSDQTRIERTVAASVLLLATALAGCGTGEPAPAAEADDGSVATDSTVPAAEPGSALPTLRGEGPPREYELLLINPLQIAAYVFGEAGAARIALDTVPAGDSSRVILRVRSTDIDLDVEDASGRPVTGATVELHEGAVNRWVIGATTEPADAPASVTDSTRTRL